MNRLTKHFLAVVVSALFVAVACAGTSYAQGSRKDDVVFNPQGRPLAGATVRVCTAAATGQPCSPLASIYSDVALTQALANPLSADGMGNYSFYAAPGRYEIEISGPGITTKQLPNVILPSDPSSPTFTTVTTTSGISAFSLSLTGNLTVSGSTSVAGTLSVGGAPVPSAAADNQWTASQRFKGPIPWRDFTAYMKDSNGNAVNCSSTDTSAGADTTGTISLSTPTTLALASAADFKTGCGIAVLGAGPAPTVVTPPSGISVSSVTSAANVVTVAASSNHNLVVGSGNGAYQGVHVSGCSNSAYNGTFPIQSIPSTTTFTYNTTSSGSGSTSGCAVTVFFGYAHGTAGSTSYTYVIAAIDANMGYSAASTTAVTITNGNSALSKYNYNHIMWAEETGAYMYAVYQNAGSGYTCVGTAFTNGYSDMGFTNPCPVFVPSTPPSSPGSDALNTTILSGGGTASLTLAASASTGVTSAGVYHDESSFVTACINDVIADETSAYHSLGGWGCYIPAGTWWINGQMPTATVSNAQTTYIKVAGNLVFHTIPWFVNKGDYFIQGIGGAGQIGSFDHEPHTVINLAPSVPAVIVCNGGCAFSNFAAYGIHGDGIWATGGLHADNNYIGEFNGGGIPVHLEANILGVWLNDDNLEPASVSGGMPAVMISYSPYNSITSCCFYLNNLYTQVHGIGIIDPGGNGTGGAGTNTINITNWLQEDQDPLDEGMIMTDSGPNAPGATTSSIGASNVSLTNVINSDVAGSNNSVFAVAGSSASLGTISLSNVGTGYVAQCVNNASACSNSPLTLGGLFVENGPTNLTKVGEVSSGFVQDFNYHLAGSTGANVSIGPQIITQNGGGGSAATVAWAMILPAPENFSVSSTGSGSLGADTYCMGATGLDANGYETNLSNVVCQAVSASSDIVVQWFQGVAHSLNQSFSGFNFYYCAVSSGTCDPTNPASSPHEITGISAGGNPMTYTFTSTSGASSATPPANSAAQLSWLSWDAGTTPNSCFFCVSTNSDYWPVGFGTKPTAGAGINIFTAKGIRAGTQYQASETTAPSGVASVDLLYADSTAHQWKKIENNGAAFSVAGTLAGTTGSIGGASLTAGQCASGTVSVSNSTTSMTVSVSPNTYPGDGFIPLGYVSTNGTVTVKVCAAASGTPTSSTYNVRVIQ